ncbi:putative spermidine/putrescine transport system substrate-binding protein [Pseudomonas flavescens]|uniref:Putative spermidine/putrescine transport system substrate-binding protein n=1 Tax=Phytopseudomonas flavescens TaxID=29435 RepID=A0A1G8H6A3_9GAMM|nr:ABC transporter substrate-binding protein [Pseudomonas flavescens]SDI02187.1 putative spermidine/putrescine transport system substrate-binding protein [Pseudomonas flavescens]
MTTPRSNAFTRAGLALLVSASAQAFAEDITFVSQGGAYQEAQSRAILEPAAKKLGLTLKQDSSPKAYPIIKTQVQSGKVSWDVVDLPTGDCIRGQQEGLFEKLDLALIPNAAKLPAELKDAYSVGYISYSTVLAYRTDAFDADTAPKTWADFWDTEKFPGQRSLRNLPRPTLEIALMADGVAPDMLYPLDVDRAFRKLEAIKPHIATWWTSGGQSAQLISDGEVDMIQAWNGRITAVQADGAPVAFDYAQGVLETNSLCVLKGSAHKDAAMKFVNEAIDAKLQAALPLIIDYGPLNPEAFDTGIIPSERAGKLPSSPANLSRQAVLSAQWWASPAGVEAEERWLSFVQKK